jgi:hypothetical protein
MIHLLGYILEEKKSNRLPDCEASTGKGTYQKANMTGLT